eukprot:8961131-Heterocapsa_arctica.AAC.1
MGATTLGGWTTAAEALQPRLLLTPSLADQRWKWRQNQPADDPKGQAGITCGAFSQPPSATAV